MRTHPLDTNLDNALDAFHRANKSKNIIRIEIFENLFSNTCKPFLPGDKAVADKVDSINSRLGTRFYLICKENKKGLFFSTITEENDFYLITAEHTTEPIKIYKDLLFEAVDVYEVLYYERTL